MAVTTGGQASTGTATLPSEITPQETVPAQALSIRNKLLFAQAVHRLGAPVGKSVGNNWNAVVSLLRDSPALSEEEKAVFTEHVSTMLQPHSHLLVAESPVIVRTAVDSMMT
jgi:hypothetical protein